MEAAQDVTAIQVLEPSPEGSSVQFQTVQPAAKFRRFIADHVPVAIVTTTTTEEGPDLCVPLPNAIPHVLWTTAPHAQAANAQGETKEEEFHLSVSSVIHQGAVHDAK